MLLFAVGACALTVATRAALEPIPATLDVGGTFRSAQLVDRTGVPLNVTFENDWNVHDRLPLQRIPPFLREAFIHAEDKRFREHGGADWRARAAALLTNLRHGRAVRGASTITEQVVRMLEPRPRTVWTRWVEGFEAARLETWFTKDAILEFYLNQVPYASNRRGVAQAASHYFARDLDTLSRREMLTLAVLVRSPSRLDPYRSLDASDAAVRRLADAMLERGAITAAEHGAIMAEALVLEAPRLTVRAPHFVQYALAELDEANATGANSWQRPLQVTPRIRTTLDAGLQLEVQRLLDRRLEHLGVLGVDHGAVLVADNASGEVRVWAVAGGGGKAGPRSHIDAVTTPRQPGSALKPFLYALALERGWTVAEIIDDSPLAAEVGSGLHRYRNYSGRHYGPVTVRDALGNSLNIPALRTLHFVGSEAYLARLHALGFRGLDAHPDVYGDGIALGSGAVTLLELVQAYTALANRGVVRPLTVFADDDARPAVQVVSPEAASLIADVLSDSEARALEFGRDSVHDLPVQTAVKTGTSSDYRDAWAVGFDSRHTVGIWVGNLDQTPTRGVTGSTGPALLLRSVFALLNHNARPAPLYRSPRLTAHTVCVPSPAAAVACVLRREWFAPGTEPGASTRAAAPTNVADGHSGSGAIRIRQPSARLMLAFDPRLPPEAQAFEFAVDGLGDGDRVQWTIDGESLWVETARYAWPVTRGQHRVEAAVWRDGALIAELPVAELVVK